jgi:hypothetical protein
MFRDHPHTAGILEPLWSAIFAGVLAGLVGLAFGAASKDSAIVAAQWATVAAMTAGLITRIAWVEGVIRTYLPTPPPPAPAPIPILAVPVHEPDYIEVTCRQPGNNSTHFIDKDLPLELDSLIWFAKHLDLVKALTYSVWVGAGENFLFHTNEDFNKCLEWMVSRGWANGGFGETKKLTSFGQCVLSDIALGALDPTPPSIKEDAMNNEKIKKYRS